MNLNYAMVDNGRVLGTRSRGKAVADHLSQLAPYVGEDESVLIDFEDVEVISPPFIQEVLAELARLFGDRPEFVGMNEDVADTFDFVTKGGA